MARQHPPHSHPHLSRPRHELITLMGFAANCDSDAAASDALSVASFSFLSFSFMFHELMLMKYLYVMHFICIKSFYTR